MKLLRRMVRHPIFHFLLALLFAPVLAIAAEAFAGPLWLILGGAVSCAIIAYTGGRAFLYERAIRGKVRITDRYIIVIGLVAFIAAIAATFLLLLFVLQSLGG